MTDEPTIATDAPSPARGNHDIRTGFIVAGAAVATAGAIILHGVWKPTDPALVHILGSHAAAGSVAAILMAAAIGGLLCGMREADGRRPRVPVGIAVATVILAITAAIGIHGFVGGDADARAAVASLRAHDGTHVPRASTAMGGRIEIAVADVVVRVHDRDLRRPGETVAIVPWERADAFAAALATPIGTAP